MEEDPPLATPGKRAVAILTHHKCASTFLVTYIDRFCELNRWSVFKSHLGSAQPAGGYDLSILTNASYPCVAGALPGFGIHVIRNPLDVVVSAYHSHRASHSLEGWPELQRQRSILTTSSVEAGLYLTLTFLERDDFYRETPGPLHALRHWPLDGAAMTTLRMEDLVGDVNGTLGTLLLAHGGRGSALPDPDEFTFRRMSGGRAAGQVDNASHYRSGRPGAWREELPEPIIAYIRTNFRSLLERYYPESLA